MCMCVSVQDRERELVLEKDCVSCERKINGEREKDSGGERGRSNTLERRVSRKEREGERGRRRGWGKR